MKIYISKEMFLYDVDIDKATRMITMDESNNVSFYS
jgi:hypothetical protein